MRNYFLFVIGFEIVWLCLAYWGKQELYIEILEAEIQGVNTQLALLENEVKNRLFVTPENKKWGKKK